MEYTKNPQSSALRLVLVVSLPQDDATALLDCSPADEPCALWPSTLYGCLAGQMLASPASWDRAAAQLDRRLAPWLGRFEGRSAIALASAARDGRGVWEAREFAALLWSLVRRREPGLEGPLARLVAEAEVALLQMAASGGAPRRAGDRAHRPSTPAGPSWANPDGIFSRAAPGGLPG